MQKNTARTHRATGGISKNGDFDQNGWPNVKILRKSRTICPYLVPLFLLVFRRTWLSRFQNVNTTVSFVWFYSRILTKWKGNSLLTLSLLSTKEVLISASALANDCFATVKRYTDGRAARPYFCRTNKKWKNPCSVNG